MTDLNQFSQGQQLDAGLLFGTTRISEVHLEEESFALFRLKDG
jgi:hypothetical protein